MKIKQIKPKVKKVNYKTEDQDTEQNPQPIPATQKTSSLGQVSDKMRQEIKDKADFASMQNITQTELSEKEDDLNNAFANYLANNGVDPDILKTKLSPELQTKADALANALSDYMQNSNNMSGKTSEEIAEAINQTLGKASNDYDNNHNQPNSIPSSPVEAENEPQNASGSNENEEDGQTLAQSERAFLDAFYELQTAGFLLGLVPSGEKIQNTFRHNALYPRKDEVLQSDKIWLDEFNQNKEVFDLLRDKYDEMLGHLNKMVASKVLANKGD